MNLTAPERRLLETSRRNPPSQLGVLNVCLAAAVIGMAGTLGDAWWQPHQGDLGRLANAAMSTACACIMWAHVHFRQTVYRLGAKLDGSYSDRVERQRSTLGLDRFLDDAPAGPSRSVTAAGPLELTPQERALLDGARGAPARRLRRTGLQVSVAALLLTAAVAARQLGQNDVPALAQILLFVGMCGVIWGTASTESAAWSLIAKLDRERPIGA
jgi:hypothetical protein